MSKFNLGKFNVKKDKASVITGGSEVKLGSNCNSIIVEKFLGKGDHARIAIGAKADHYIEITSNRALASISLNAKALSSNLVYGTSISTNNRIIIGASAIGSLLGEEYVEIKNLNLKPGEELEIDMCNLTVTKNGENALHLMAAGGDFFDFLVGDNDLEIEAEGADKVQIDTYWKDKWL